MNRKRFLSILLVFALLSGLLPCLALLSQAEETILSEGVQNIVKRAYQMTNIQWTPVADITGWGGGVTYQTGVTYTGLPYGQPVDASYVPWSTDLAGFIDAVNDEDSNMYTSYATYNKRAPYYSIECSAFVSWAWGLSSRQTTSSIHYFATEISTSSYADAEVGDCLCLAGTHVVLITDITYDSSGAINSIEIAESTTNTATNYCCQLTRYGENGSYTLDYLTSKYFENGYILYRSNTRDSVTYTHSCAVPLDGDVCSLCQSGSASGNTDTSAATAFGIDVSHHQGTIDWDTVAEQIDFAIIRCGYGDDLTSQDDTQWVNNVEACIRLDIPFGVYIYSYALTDAQALSEAEHVLRLLDGYVPDLPIYLDLEDSTILENCSTDDILRHAQIFCEAIEEAGYSAGIYANYNWWTNYLTAEEYDQWNRWIARYASSTGYSKDYTIWQFSSSGSVNGISGNVDLNYWYGDFPSRDDYHEHIYTSYISQAATCTTAGTRIYSCDCGNSYTDSIAATGHSYQTITVTASCTLAGSMRHTCTVCGSTYTESVPATGHDYTSSVIEPTCTEPGCTVYTCRICGSSYQDIVTESLGHSYVDGVCTVCGIENMQVTKGDLNGDGEVTSADSVLLARYVVGLVELTDEQILAADVNDDGEVTSADSVLVARYLAGVITGF